MIRVFIADDHHLVRRGIAELLTETGGMVVAGEAANAGEVLDGLPSARPDVIVMDFSMPGRSGFDLLKDLRIRHPRIPILVLSMHPEERFAVRALKAGAAGYLTKEADPRSLLAAIRSVAGGRRFVSPSLAERLAEDLGTGRSHLPHETLSDREFQVFCLLASGRTVKSIAADLHLSFRTINTFRTRILRKMGLRSTVELTHYAMRNGLID